MRRGKGNNRDALDFVVDGLVAHVNRQHAGNILLASYVARGFD